MASFGEAPATTEAAPEVAPATESAPAPAATAGGDEGDEGGDDDAPVEQEESTATFEALVQLEEVEVKTHEEDEEVLYSQRSKLFAYTEASLDKGTGNKSWCERGVGDCKLLKHKESGRIRILMRQEGTLKIITNHFVDPRITLCPNVGNDKSWVWMAHDFSNGVALEEMTFAIRFKDAEIAGLFKTAFASAQDDNKQFVTGADSTEGAAEADELANIVEKVAV